MRVVQTGGNRVTILEVQENVQIGAAIRGSRMEDVMRYEVNVSRLENPSGNIRGFVNVVFNNCFKVSNIVIVEVKEDNIFVSMPRYATSRGDEDYKDVCNPITKEFREELYSTILDAFDTLEPDERTKVNVGKDEKKEPLDFNVKVTPFEREGSNIRGLARVYLADAFVINNVSLLEGRNGLFVAMPSYKVKQAGENGKGEYQDICYPVTKAFREKLYGAVTEAYELAKEGQEKQQTSEKPEEKRKAAGKDEKWLEAPAGDTPFR